ncbi:MAG: hypothetical protein ACUVXC_04510, partial [Chloroflexus sp.]
MIRLPENTYSFRCFVVLQYLVQYRASTSWEGGEIMLTAELAAFIDRMPKVELHLHLEGAVMPQTFLALSRRNNISLPVQTEEEL